MAGFRLGDHQFVEPPASGPLSRLWQQQRRPIQGAPPPAFLTGFVEPPLGDGPSAELEDGGFCGHGEPTYTVFDLVLDGQRELNIALPIEDADEPTLLVRVAGSEEPWRKVFSLHEAFPYCGYRAGGQAPQPLVDEQGAIVSARAAVGCEYPCDAEKVDDVSWVAVAIEYGPQRERAVVFSRETA